VAHNIKKGPKKRNLVRNNLKGKSYEIKTQRTSRESALKKSLIRVTGGSTIAPNENQNKNLEAKR